MSLSRTRFVRFTIQLPASLVRAKPDMAPAFFAGASAGAFRPK